MTKNKLLFTLALALTVWPGHATAQELSDSDRFKLFNECGPMHLVVEDYGDAGWADIGLTVDRIQTMAESRLRAARLYDATTWHIGAAGTHSGDARFILQGLSEALDRFILEYLRVNEDACDQTR